VKRSDLAGHAGYGYCASHSRWFWGFRLYLITTAEGMPVIWGLVRAGQVSLGDKALRGTRLRDYITGTLGAHLIRPDRKDETPRFGRLARCRQWIEAVIDTLKGQLTLEQHGGRTLAGSTPAPPPACSPSPRPSGTTGKPARPSSDRSWPTITEDQLDSLI
jgi:hypothetical protein